MPKNVKRVAQRAAAKQLDDDLQLWSKGPGASGCSSSSASQSQVDDFDPLQSNVDDESGTPESWSANALNLSFLYPSRETSPPCDSDASVEDSDLDCNFQDCVMTLYFGCDICINCRCGACDQCIHTDGVTCMHCDYCQTLTGDDSEDDEDSGESSDEFFDCDEGFPLDVPEALSESEQRDLEAKNDFIDIVLQHNATQMLTSDMLAFFSKTQLWKFPKKCQNIAENSPLHKAQDSGTRLILA